MAVFDSDDELQCEIQSFKEPQPNLKVVPHSCLADSNLRYIRNYILVSTSMVVKVKAVVRFG